MLLVFVLAAAISAIGSLQAGAVNLSVLRRALAGQGSEARWLAVGGSLPEAAYAALAVGLGSWMGLAEWAGPVLRIAFPALLAALGLYYWLKPTHVPDAQRAPQRAGAFASGLALAAANPQLLPFWLLVCAYLREQHWMADSFAHAAAFSVGAWAGALGLLLGIAHLGQRLHFEPTVGRLRTLDRVTGTVLLLLSALALVPLLR